MKDLSRLARRLRRKVYRQMPVASPTRIAELDPRMSYAEMVAAVEQGALGVSSAGTALALWRAYSERGLRAWCYEFGFPESLTYTVTIVEVDGALEVHDAFCNLTYLLSFHGLLDALRYGNVAAVKASRRDRKIYIADPGAERGDMLSWLEANAAREFEPIDGLRRYELLWSLEAFTAIGVGIDAAFRELDARGFSRDLQFLMLHPLAVFDGEQHHREPARMPLISGRDLRSPVAALRLARRELERERLSGAEKAAKIAHLEAQLTDANVRAARLGADRDEADRGFAAERQAWLRQKVALQAANNALEGELAETRSRLEAATNLRAQKDSQIAQLRAENDDIREQFGASSRECQELRRRARAAEEQAIEISDYLAPLVDEVSQLRCDARLLAAEYETVSREKAELAAQIAASPRARLRLLWRR
ncbi:MAG TPA: hypothetical protein VE687_18480, partial [Stellaceae bacterium]|nr:hypothetical protein [Stellaceae bacterium]